MRSFVSVMHSSMKRFVFLCFGILLVGVIVYLQQSGVGSTTMKQILVSVCHTIEGSLLKIFKHVRSFVA
jgi:hypothetical protein